MQAHYVVDLGTAIRGDVELLLIFRVKERETTIELALNAFNRFFGGRSGHELLSLTQDYLQMTTVRKGKMSSLQ